MLVPNKCSKECTIKSLISESYHLWKELGKQTLKKYHLKMMNENSRKFGKHYELPLPLENPATTKVPNNSYLAEKRLLSLKKRFLKDPDFLSDYKGFVEELNEKGMQANLIKKPQNTEPGISHIMVYTTLANLGR